MVTRLQHPPCICQTFECGLSHELFISRHTCLQVHVYEIVNILLRVAMSALRFLTRSTAVRGAFQSDVSPRLVRSKSSSKNPSRRRFLYSANPGPSVECRVNSVLALHIWRQSGFVRLSSPPNFRRVRERELAASTRVYTYLV
jgi:hypothetical protein